MSLNKNCFIMWSCYSLNVNCAKVPINCTTIPIDFYWIHSKYNALRCTCWITSGVRPAASLINPERRERKNWMLNARAKEKTTKFMDLIDFLSIFFLLFQALIEEHCKWNEKEPASSSWENVKLHVIFASKFNYPASVLFHPVFFAWCWLDERDDRCRLREAKFCASE